MTHSTQARWEWDILHENVESFQEILHFLTNAQSHYTKIAQFFMVDHQKEISTKEHWYEYLISDDEFFDNSLRNDALQFASTRFPTTGSESKLHSSL